MKEPKFKIGDVVKHKSINTNRAIRLLVTQTGTLKDNDGESIIYGLSFEDPLAGLGEAHHTRTILNEDELELIDLSKI